MSDFFSPLEEDDVCRTRQDEDEERLAEEALDAVGDRARVFALWNEETRNALEHGALNPSTLLVATTPWACGLVFDTVEAGALELRPMGTITVSGVSARGVAASETIGGEDPVGTLFRVDQRDALVLTVNHDVPADRAREYAVVLSETIEASNVVVMTAVDDTVVDESAERKGDDRRCFATLANARADEADELEMSDISAPLPAGVLLDGIAAAIAARREMTGGRCVLIAVPTPAGMRGSATGSRGAGAGAGPGFGGGVDARVAKNAARLASSVAGIDLVAGLEWRRAAGNGKVVGGDAERVFS